MKKMISDMRCLFLLLTLLLGVNTPAGAVMTLDGAYRMALANDAKLASSEARLEADSRQTEQALARLLPQVTATGSVKKEQYTLPDSSTSFDETTSNINVQITQPLYDREAFYTWDQAGIKVDYAKLRFANDKNELGVRVAEAYLNVLLMQENVLLSESLVDSTKERLAQISAALKVGYATKVDSLSLVAELDDSRARLTADRQQLLFFREKLKVLTGKDLPDTLPWPTFNAADLLNRFIKDKEWLQEARENNYSVQMQEKAVDIARQEEIIRKSTFYPTINAGAAYSDSTGSTFFAQKNENTILYLEMKIPLYQGGYDISRLRESRALLRSAELDRRYAALEANQQAQEQISAIYSSVEILAALKQAAVSSASYLASAEEGYRLGVRDISEVSRAKEKVYDNHRNQIRTSVDLLNGLVLLHAVSGQLDGQAIQQISDAVW
jgi:TolC family type I secretion outer membrane protein